MPESTRATMAAIAARYVAAFPRSASLYERARASSPQGVHSHVRYLSPCPVYAERASGCRKQLVDGPELVDYWMGHASLLLGHAEPAIVAAAREQIGRGTHF